MAEPDWNRIQDLFHQACELEESERAAFLDGACGDNAEERSLIERMLAEDADPPALLDKEPAHLAAMLLDTEDDLPATVGPYVVDRLIGHGGMGLVLLAERPDLPRKVALKLVRDRWLGSETAQRFHREQAVLARLKHPNIARLLNVGTDDDGAPYLTMDYVDGVPITEYAVDRNLAIAEKLALIVDVCKAVQYAHQNLVVHRDLKPSNILVDRDGEVKLLDFGIAKLLEVEDGEVETMTSNHLMTPLYASPEQLAGEPVTTASDVYSLGVVMYELLVGRRPYDLEGRSATEALRILTEAAPRRPSSVSETEVGRRGLRGDLDNILLKALQRDPSARYASMEAMLADIQRHRNGFPVGAREATIPYRLRKFVTRHKVGFGITMGVVLVLAALASTIVIQRSETARERERAERESERAERTAEFLMGLFQANDPSQALGDTMSVRQLLSRGIEQADALADQPALQAETYAVIGNVYRSLGQNAQAGNLLERALEVQRADPDHVEADVASTLRGLSEVYTSDLRTDDAISTAEEALQIARRTSAPPSTEIARGLNSLGLALGAAGRYNDADSVLNLSYEQMRTLKDEDDQESVQVLANRLKNLMEVGRYEEAEGVGRTVLSWRKANLPPNHPATAEALDFLAVTLRNLARYDEAAPLYEEALAVKTAVFGPTHPSTAGSILNLAIFYGIQGRYREAEPYFVRAVDAYSAAFGSDSPRTANTLNMYAVLLGRTGRFDEAAKISRRAMKIQSETLGPGHPNTVATLYNLANSLCYNYNFDACLPLLRQAAVGHREAFGTDSHRYAEVLASLGYHEARAGNFETGIADATQAYEINRRTLGADHQRTAFVQGLLGRAMLASGKFAEADGVLRQAYSRYTAHVESNDPSAVAMTDGIGQIRTHLGAHAEADSLLRYAYDVRLDRLGPDHPFTRETAQHIRELYRAWGREAPGDLIGG